MGFHGDFCIHDIVLLICAAYAAVPPAWAKFRAWLRLHTTCRW